jgi:hypothetical protein
MNTAWKVDLVIRKDRPFSVLELRRRVVLPIADVDVPTATAEDTIIAKLEWAKLGASERQLVDVAGILRVRSATLDLTYVEHWVEELDLVGIDQRHADFHSAWRAGSRPMSPAGAASANISTGTPRAVGASSSASRSSELHVEHGRQAPGREQLRQHERRELDDAAAGVER